MICYGLSLSLGHMSLSFLDLNCVSDNTFYLKELQRSNDIIFVGFVNCKL